MALECLPVKRTTSNQAGVSAEIKRLFTLSGGGII
jgi:hypothetical protein